MSNSHTHLAKLSVSLVLISVAIIAYQLVLIQILSILQWYHFAYMIISVALLGFGAAGTFIAIFRKYLLKNIDSLLPVLMILSGLLMSIVIRLSQTSIIRFDSFRLFSDYTNLWKLLTLYLLFFLPFFFGALAIGLIFVKHVKKIGILYFANMLGSGAGSFAAIILMWYFFPEKLPALISVMAVAAGLVVVPKKLRSGFTIVITLSVAVIVYNFVIPPDLKLSEYKSLSKILNLPDTKIIEKESSPYGLIDVVDSPYLRYAPGLSIKYPNQVSVNNASFNNGNWFGPLISLKADSLNYLKYTTEFLPYFINRRKDVLILGAGTGRLIWQAISNNATNITAVEPNKAITKLLMQKLQIKVGSVYNKREVKLNSISPRTYLLKSSSKFDLITLPVIGSFGGTSGLFALQEQYILTKEAFNEMWGRLDDDGVLSISTWIDYPYRKPIKILTTLTEMLSDRGIENTRDYIAAIKNWNIITFLIKRSALTEKEIFDIREYCKKMNFDPVILPGVNDSEREQFNRLRDKSFYVYIDRILSSRAEREKLYSEYAFNIRPATDNKPYFSQFLQWKSVSQLSKLFGRQAVPFFEVGYILLYLTFIQIILFAFLLIVLPLFKIGWTGTNKLGTFLYFGGIGIGYMFVEIIFIQRFTLYFGNVIYAAAAVISLMLISSGFGSLISQKISAKQNRIIGIIFIIIISLIIYAVFLSSLLRTTIIFSLATKIIFTTLLISPIAFFMGMPFPLGLRWLSSQNDVQVPWAWGINGVFSVVSSVLATIVAVELGFVWVMVFSAVAYGLVLLVNLRTGERY